MSATGKKKSVPAKRRTAAVARTPDPDNRADGVQVIRRAAQILDSLREHPEGLSLSQIADRTGLARSTIHRLIGALASERFVMSASPRGRYRLGPAISGLALASEANIVVDLHPELAALARQVDETVDLAVLEHDHIRFVHQIPAMQRLRAVSAVGAIFPAHCTANGKVLLAELPVALVTRLLPEQLERFTPNTLGTREELLDELAQIRVSKLAIDHEEHTLGICAVGIAVDDGRGHKVAITVPMPAQRLEGNEQRIGKALLGARRRIEHAGGR